MPRAPIVGRIAAGTVWTGKEVLVVGGVSGTEKTDVSGGAAYNPAARTWRRLPAGSGVTGDVEAWTGKELLIVGGTGRDRFATPVAAALNPATGKWRVLERLNTLTGLLQYGTFWTGSRVILVGERCITPNRGSTYAGYRPVYVSYDPRRTREGNSARRHRRTPAAA